jgi:hypothetical protein
MKMSKRNIENKIREEEKLIAGPPAVSKFAKKHMDEEQYQELMRRERKLVRGIVTR